MHIAHAQTHLKLYRHDTTKESLIPIGAGRNCQQTLETWPGQHLKRTLDGTLHDVRTDTMQKWLSIITCEDQSAPALDDFQVGNIIHVNCILAFSQWIHDKQETTLSRPPAEGQAIFQDSQTLKETTLKNITTDKNVKLDQPSTGWITYRPQLTMRVKHYAIDCQEWKGKTSWKLSLEEV